MPKIKNLSGKNVVDIFSRFGFKVISQRGSHAKLRRVLNSDTQQTLTVPFHEELDKGTLKAIFRQASRYIPEEKLRPYFYSD
jgi:predicted RNA binding protein YcfA (HicA-like mRNA interferase family)